MNVFLFSESNSEIDKLFKDQLKQFADDYGLTLEEAKDILANMAALRVKDELKAIV